VQVYLSNPIPHVVEALITRAIVSQDNSHCTFIVSLSDGPEAFLASCVPNLELHIFSVYVYGFDLKVDPYNDLVSHLIIRARILKYLWLRCEMK